MQSVVLWFSPMIIGWTWLLFAQQCSTRRIHHSSLPILNSCNLMLPFLMDTNRRVLKLQALQQTTGGIVPSQTEPNYPGIRSTNYGQGWLRERQLAKIWGISQPCRHTSMNG